METNVTPEIKYFIEFLNSNWNTFTSKIGQIESKDEWQKNDLLNDWLQFNWEMFVESFICNDNEYLISYGLGAECNYVSDRVRFPEKKPSHKIVCKSKNSKLVKDYISNELISIDDKEFYKFVSYTDIHYSDSPPFDYLLIQDNSGEYYMINNEDVYFLLVGLNC